jgi:hypothetical protein
MENQEEIRLIAYRLWEEEGCPHGRDTEHWLKAESVWQDRQKNLRPEAILPGGRSNRPPQKAKSSLRKLGQN